MCFPLKPGMFDIQLPAPPSVPAEQGWLPSLGRQLFQPCFWRRDRVDPFQRHKNKAGKGWGRICVGPARAGGVSAPCPPPWHCWVMLPPQSGRAVLWGKGNGKTPCPDIPSGTKAVGKWICSRLQTCPGHRPRHGGQGGGARDANCPTLPFPRSALGIAACPHSLPRARGRIWGHLG